MGKPSKAKAEFKRFTKLLDQINEGIYLIASKGEDTLKDAMFAGLSHKAALTAEELKEEGLVENQYAFRYRIPIKAGSAVTKGNFNPDPMCLFNGLGNALIGIEGYSRLEEMITDASIRQTTQISNDVSMGRGTRIMVLSSTDDDTLAKKLKGLNNTLEAIAKKVDKKIPASERPGQRTVAQ